MIFKYYTADLMAFGKNELQTPSITVKVYRWANPCDVVTMIKNQLELDGYNGHKLFNLRRIK